MKKSRKTIYYITATADAYNGGDGLYQIKDEQGDETNITFYTGFYSKKKAKRAFKTIALCSSYDRVILSVEKHTKQEDGEWMQRGIGEITLINEEQERKIIKDRLKELNW